MKKRRDEEDEAQRINEARNALRRRLNLSEEELRRPEPQSEQAEQVSSRPVKPGDLVQIKSMGVKAEVLSVSPDRVLSLKAGIMNVTAREDEVLLLEGETVKQKKQAAVHRLLSAQLPDPAPDRPAGHGGHRGGAGGGALPGLGGDGPAQDRDHHPRQGHRRSAHRDPGHAAAQQVRQELPSGPIRRGRGGRHGGGTQVKVRPSRERWEKLAGFVEKAYKTAARAGEIHGENNESAWERLTIAGKFDKVIHTRANKIHRFV